MYGSPTFFFKAAGEMAAISGASLAGAAAVQHVVLGGKEERSPGRPGAGGATQRSLSTGVQPLALPGAAAQEARPTQNITLQVYALDPTAVNWDKLMEDNIAPALERLSGGRNYNLRINVATA
jgi:hypothetical protein